MNLGNMSLLAVLGAGAAGLVLAITATFFLGRAMRNYSIVDAVWALLFTPLVLAYSLLLDGIATRQAVLCAIVALWSLRLGLHLAQRTLRAHPEEDRRYAALRTSWGDAVHGKMFGFYQLQALFSLLLSAPFLLAAANPAPFPHPLEWIALLVFVIALAGEAVADAQLRRFKSRRPAPHAVCREGLWSVSRHPNYFFEWLVWVAFALFALPAPYGWLGLIAPAAMLHLLLNVTGIPATEAAAVASKGEAYRDYQRTTNAFFPWPRRRSSPAT
jgi:steroid 5-alpha reductase family enzyme